MEKGARPRKSANIHTGAQSSGEPQYKPLFYRVDEMAGCCGSERAERARARRKREQQPIDRRQCEHPSVSEKTALPLPDGIGHDRRGIAAEHRRGRHRRGVIRGRRPGGRASSRELCNRRLE